MARFEVAVPGATLVGDFGETTHVEHHHHVVVDLLAALDDRQGDRAVLRLDEASDEARERGDTAEALRLDAQLWLDGARAGTRSDPVARALFREMDLRALTSGPTGSQPDHVHDRQGHGTPAAARRPPALPGGLEGLPRRHPLSHRNTHARQH